jgi:hypothetical protein
MMLYVVKGSRLLKQDRVDGVRENWEYKFGFNMEQLSEQERESYKKVIDGSSCFLLDLIDSHFVISKSIVKYNDGNLDTGSMELCGVREHWYAAVGLIRPVLLKEADIISKTNRIAFTDDFKIWLTGSRGFRS